MTATVERVEPPPQTGDAAGAAAVGLAVRQVRVGAVVVGVLSAGLGALVAVQHASLVADPGALAALDVLSTDPAIRTLFGPPRALADPGGFTVWRTGTSVAVLVAVWSLLAATRTTRGEEDAGQWALLLSGTLDLRQVLLRHLAVLVAADLLFGMLIALGLVAAGTAGAGAALHGAGIALTGAFFASVGVLAAQALPDRRSASGAAAGVLLVSLLVRTAADALPALSWARWATPFGLLGELRPYAGDRPAPLAVLAGGALLLTAAARAVAGRRDVGDGVLRPRTTRRPRTALLGSVPAFLLRRTLRPWAAWATALAAQFLLIGLLATSVTTFVRHNPRLAELAGEAGFHLASAEGYVAGLFGLLAIPVGLFAASRLAADASDEHAGRLHTVLAAPVSRVQWLGWHAALLLAASLALCAVAGTAAWTGAVLVGTPLSSGDALAGAVNAVPVAGLSVGTAALALGWAPRAVLVAGAVPVVGGFVWLVLADSLAWPTAVRAVSPFAHLAPVPAETPDVGGAAVLLALAVVLVAAGAAGLRRRDVAG